MPRLFSGWKSSAATRRAPAPRKPARYRPSFDCLERRDAPAVITVTTVDDTVDANPFVTSLREAMTAANMMAGDDFVVFDSGVSGILQLGSALPTITTNMTILGHGPASLTVRRNVAGDFRIFSVNDGVNANISGLTLTNGQEINGGAIDNGGTLQLSDCVLQGNKVLVGGQGGGAIRNREPGVLTVTGCTFTGNSTDNGGGGGILNFGILHVTQSTFQNNSTVTFGGGGIFSQTGSLFVDSCLFADNVGSPGGAIRNASGNATILNSTLSDNDSSLDGGGLHVDAGTVTLRGCTITRNLADFDGGGELGGGIQVAGGTVTLFNTLVAGNSAGNPQVSNDINGTVSIFSRGNLVGNGTGLAGMGNGINTNQVGTAASPINPLLGPLADNGGPTRTHALLVGSPALDTGVDDDAGQVDQRGRPRGVFAQFTPRFDDIGAFEAQIFFSDFTNQSTNEDVSPTINFGVAGFNLDGSTFTATSSNQALALIQPNAFGGGGFDRTLSIQVLGDQTGTSTITVTAIAPEGERFTDTFVLTVNAQNDPPTAIALSATAVNENVATNTAIGTFSATDIDSGAFTFSLVAGAGSTDNASFTINGNQLQTAAALDFETKSSFSIRVRADDGAGGTFDQVFTITVNDLNEVPPNTAPVNTVPGTQTIFRNGNVVFRAANGNAFDVADEADTGNILVNFTASAGTFSVAAAAGVTALGNGSGSVSLLGTVTAVKSALAAGVTFTSAPGFTGAATITMTTNDLGAPGGGTPMTDTDVITVQVNNRLPTAGTLTKTYSMAKQKVLNVPAANGLLQGVTDPDGDPLTIQLLSNPIKGTLIVNNDGSFTFTRPGAFRKNVTFQYRVTDGLGNSETISVTITFK